MKLIHSEQDIDALRRSAQAYAIASAWSAAGLFEALAQEEPLSANELPADTRAIEITAPILAHIGLLAGDGEKWTLSTAGRRLFEADALSLESAEDNLGDLSRLDQVLENGGPVCGPDGESRVTQVGVREKDPENIRRFQDFLYRRSGDSAAEAARWLAPLLTPNAKVLDLGGGHGRYGQALAEKGFAVTLFDLPLCIDYARQRYGNTFEYIAGDFMQADLGGPYDAVLISNIVHGLGPEENRGLVSRVSAVLKPGGWLLLKDMFLDDSGIGPENAALFGLMMLFYTRQGRSYSVREMNDLCGACGLGEIRHVRVPDAGFSLLLARKP